MADTINTFNDLEELRLYIEERLKVADPTLDVSSGSSIDSQFISPLIERLGPDPYNTDLSAFMLGRITTEFQNLSIQEGDPLYDYAILIMSILLEPFRRQIQQVSNNQSFAEPSTLSDNEADKLGANYFTSRRQGGYAVGIAKLYFSSPQYVVVTPSNPVFTSDDLRFYPVENQAITADNMLFNVEGTLYYFDIIVRAREQGEEYNIDPGTLVGIEGVPSVVKVTNTGEFGEGAPRETTEEFVERIENSLTEKSLVTLRGINARLNDVFESIKSIGVIGYGDIEMERDILTGSTDAVPYAVFEGVVSAGDLDKIDLGTWINDGIPSHVDFTDAGVQVGDKIIAYDNTAGSSTTVLVETVTASQLIIDQDLPAATYVCTIGRYPGSLMISNIPGGILDPTTPYGEIEIAGDQVHIGGATDVFLRAGTPQERDINLEGIRDDQPLHFGVDLESFGEDDDEFIHVFNKIEDNARVPTEDIDGNTLGVGEKDQVLIKVRLEDGGKDTSPWFPSQEDVGRYIQLLGPTDYGTFEITQVDDMELDDMIELNFQSAGYVDAIPSDIGKSVSSAPSGDLGSLRSYDNTKRIWWVRPVIGTFDSGETASVNSGTGIGVLDEDSPFVRSVRLHLDLTMDRDSGSALADLTTKDAYEVSFRLKEEISVKDRVRDRDNSRVPALWSFGPGIDFDGNADGVGAAIGDSVILETGDDAGVYTIRRILSSVDEDDAIILDRELSKTTTPSGLGDGSGLRYRIADALDVDLVEPRVTKIPLGNIFLGGDLNTVAGSDVVTVSGGTTNFLLAGVERGDTLEIERGDNKGTYLINTVAGTQLTLESTTPSTETDLRFSVYRAFDGVSRPMVNVNDVELLDSANQATGITIPYGSHIDARIYGRLSNRDAGDVVESYTGETTSSTVLEDTEADFTQAGVLPGYRITILSGDNVGNYEVKEVTSSTQLTVVPESEGGTEFPFTTTNIYYRVGLPSSGYLRVYFIEPTSFEAETGITGAAITDEDGIRDFRFSEVDGFQMVPEFGSDEDELPRDLNVVRSELVGTGPSVYETTLELTDEDHDDVFYMELQPGDIVSVHNQIPFADSVGKELPDVGVAGTPAGLRTLTGSNVVSVPTSSLVDFTVMDTNYGLVGQYLYIESGPDAGRYIIEEVVSSYQLRLSQVMTGTTENFWYEATPRDATLTPTATPGEVDLTDATDTVPLGTQIGHYITIFEAKRKDIEGTYEIVDIDQSSNKVTIDMDLGSSIPAGEFSWVRTALDENISYEFNIYRFIPEDLEVLEVSVKDDDRTTAYKEGETVDDGGVIRFRDTTNSPFGSVEKGDRLEILLGTNAGVYVVETPTDAQNFFVYANKPFGTVATDLWYRVWGGLHGSRTMIKVGASGAGDGLVPHGKSLPYTIRRGTVFRMSSTQMQDNFDGSFYYADIPIESEGAGDDFNLEDDTRMLITSGTKADGYVYRVTNNTLTFSPYERVSLEFTRRFLPVGNSDTPANMSEISGKNLRISYGTSTIAAMVNDLLRSDVERVVCSNPIGRHFLPSYVYLTLTYQGGESAALAGQEIEDYINNLGNEDELEISDVEAFLSRRGATSITHPITIASVTHDIDRQLVVERSDNKLGGTTVPYEGTARISSYFARLGEGLNVERQ